MFRFALLCKKQFSLHEVGVALKISRPVKLNIYGTIYYRGTKFVSKLHILAPSYDLSIALSSSRHSSGISAWLINLSLMESIVIAILV